MSPLKASGQYVHSLWHALPTWPGAKSVQSVTQNGDTFLCARSQAPWFYIQACNSVIRLAIPIRIGEIVQTLKRTNKTETQQIY